MFREELYQVDFRFILSAPLVERLANTDNIGQRKIQDLG
jgi:hypothetical protein